MINKDVGFGNSGQTENSPTFPVGGGVPGSSVELGVSGWGLEDMNI